MGDLKKEIAFNGELLNVTGRIPGGCNRLGRRLLASRSPMSGLDPPSELTAKAMGAVALRGVGAPLEIVALAIGPVNANRHRPRSVRVAESARAPLIGLDGRRCQLAP